MIIQLQKPIQAHGNEVTQLEIREPTGADLMAFGFPYKDGAIDFAIFGKYMQKLCEIPPSSVAQLSAMDFMKFVTELMVFFQQPEPTEEEAAPTSSNAALTSPGFGAARRVKS